MRIARVAFAGSIAFAVIEGDEAAELEGSPVGELRFTGRRAPLADLRLLAPTLPSKILGASMNYRDHVKAMGVEEPAEPRLFLKPSTAVIGPGDPIRRPPECEQIDYEGELAVVVAGLVRNADVETAGRAILGYTVADDVTARDLQATDDQWWRAKGFDTFCPLGPWIETDLDPSRLAIETRLNGETVQSSSTSEWIFSPAELVSFASRVMTLLPGDVVLTGTPPGAGPMEPGDSVEVEISGIGVLRNEVVG